MPDPAANAEPTAIPRVVSLLPSATELVALLQPCDADTGGLLVGRSHECDFPPSVLALPVLTASRVKPAVAPGASIDPTHDPAAIDASVRAFLDASESLYSVDEVLLASLRPDLILTQDLCNVCSIDLPAVQRLARTLPGPPRVVSLNPSTIEDVLDDLLRVAAVLGSAFIPAGDRAMVALRERLFRAEDFVNPYEDGPVVAFLEWTDPLFCAGHWTVQLIERAGGRHPWNPTTPRPDAGAALGPQRGSRVAPPSRAITPAELLAHPPEAFIIAPCGFSLAQARACAEHLSRQPWWTDLPAVRDGRVAVVDGNQMFNRPGPRLVDAFEFLVGWLHNRPELIPPGFPWETFPTRDAR